MDEIQPVTASPDLPPDPMIEKANQESEAATKDKIEAAFKTLVLDYLRDESFVRDTHVRVARRNDNYWRGKQSLWWSEVANDWRLLTQPPDGYSNDEYIEQLLDEKIVNIYKAHGESIIAALSTQVPATRFFPEDAENADDIYSAKAFSKLADYLRKNNKAKLLLIRALTILFNEPFVAFYNYCETDKKYGTFRKPQYGKTSSISFTESCLNCGAVINSDEYPPEEIGEDYQPQDGMSFGQEPKYCPECQMIGGTVTDTKDNIAQGVVNYTEEPKMMAVQEAYGILNVRIPAYIAKIENSPYLCLEYDQSIALIEETYPHLRGKIVDTRTEDPQDNRWARTNQDYDGQFPKYTATVRQIWYRNWALNRIEDEEIREQLKEKFPTGCRVVYINDLIAEAHEENLDDHWTISHNPLFREICGDAIGTGLIPVQDLKNDLVNLTSETIKHGITETFVESDVLDLSRYGEEEIRPGMVYPVKTQGSKSIGESFFQTKPASLSQEVNFFNKDLDQAAQFVSGAFPSIFGGAMQNSGGTLGEYQESRTQAMQRLQIVWYLMCHVWSEMEFKSIKDYVRNVNYDTHFVQKQGSGYVNVWIKLAELTGNVANMEPESAETFPISWTQKKAVLDQLMQLNSPIIGGILSHPNNISDIAAIYGMSGLYIPGDDDRNKQLAEIVELSNSAPMMGQMGPIPSVQIEPDIDNHVVHAETIKAWLVSEAGQACKRDNQAGYANCLAHLKMHQMFMQMTAAQNAPPPTNENDVQPPPQ